jgi:CubicO group peptidase (beta-lactamase class C family)
MRFPIAGFLLVTLVVAAPPARTRMDPDRLARITPRLQAFVEKGTIAGVVALAALHGEVVYHDAVGYQALEDRKPMHKDSIFQIMSMTKPIAAVGAMILAEEGKLAISDPVEKYLPEFRGQWVIESQGPDGQGTDKKTRTLKRPSRPITIRDLMTHTSGMIYQPPEGIKELYQTLHLTLGEAVAIYSQQPLNFEPGSRWQYSNPGIATLGRVIEAAADQPLDKFLEARIFRPLEMKDSFFYPPEEKIGRIAMVYRLEDGKLKRPASEFYGGDPTKYRRGGRYVAPEFGLYSTAGDLSNLYQMMLNGGSWKGKRILSRASVDVMTEVHTGSIDPPERPSGMAYGLAWALVRDEMGTLQLQSKGTFGHGGAFGTQGWIDPAKDLVGVFLIQRSAGGDTSESKAFINLVNSAITE